MKRLFQACGIALAIITATALALGLLFAAPASAQQSVADTDAVDALFAPWNKQDTPGAVVAIMQDGKVVYNRGYGMADLERDAPNTAATVFHVASLSKQFTAFAIHLLAQDGKLSLDDDIRKYVPELHDYGQTITIAHLLHHTSGLRDQWRLLTLSGWRMEDVITEDDILQVLWRQKALNFAPGSEFTYSNSGYTLLGLIVKRVSGMSLPEFTQERMFKPLGMKNTHFHNDYQKLVKGRASSYELLPGSGYQYVALSFSNVGATSLYTTVDDLARWDQNFYDARIGGHALLAQMQTTGVLNSGKPLTYASGLIISKYRGLSTVEHGGADAGFRSNLLRFPEQHFSVSILANADDLNPSHLARKIADIYLKGALSPAPAHAPTAPRAWVEAPVAPELLDTLVGDYVLSPDSVITFTKERGQLMSQATRQDKIPLHAAGGRTFFAKTMDAQFTFDAPGSDGLVRGGILHQGGRDMPAKRVERQPPFEKEWSAKVGEFYSDELHVLYTVSHKDGKFMLRLPRGEVVLTPSGPNVFAADFPIEQIQFHCKLDAPCSGFTVSSRRVRNLRFARVSVVP